MHRDRRTAWHNVGWAKGAKRRAHLQRQSRTSDQTMFDEIEMNVVDMTREVALRGMDDARGHGAFAPLPTLQRANGRAGPACDRDASPPPRTRPSLAAAFVAARCRRG